jgi:Acyl-CoA carboxylase epsilon subunit
LTESQSVRPAVPVLTVLRGDPTPAELAALLVVLAGRVGAQSGRADTRPSRSRWSASARQRAPLLRGQNAWRASAFPG